MAEARDDFAGTGAHSGNWTDANGTWSYVAGLATGSVWPVLTRYTGVTLGARQFVTISLSGAPASSVYALGRTTAGLNGYAAVAQSTGALVSARLDAGAASNLETAASGLTYVAGDIVGVRLIDATQRVTLNGIVRGTGTADATYSAAANPGLVLVASGDTLDNWTSTDVLFPSVAAGLQAMQAVKRAGFY